MTKVRVGRSFRKGIKGQTTEGKVVRLVNNGPVGSDVIYGWASRVGRHLWIGQYSRTSFMGEPMGSFDRSSE